MDLALQLGLCVMIGYVFGCILFAELIGHFQKTSLFEHGSGNPGMANTAAVLGKKAAAFVLIGDILKTAAAAGICVWLFPDLGRLCALYAGLGATLGHCFPVWHHFEGGKGVAVVCAAYVLYAPIPGFAALACGGLAVLAKLGLKWAAFCIPVVYLIFLLFNFSWISFLPALAMGVLLSWLNLRKNRLSQQEEKEEID